MNQLIAKAYPAKSFFVNMLTRDIDLSDAILDLLDNCVDGIIRTKWKGGIPDAQKKPYNGYEAKITLDEDFFSIEDNCGGIPLEVAEKYAFTMGRKEERDDNLPTVGLYGIGMKRALFKMGAESVVYSKTETESFSVKISKDWLKDDNNWDLPLKLDEENEDKDQGTKIEVKELYNSISSNFVDEGFKEDLRNTIARHYSFIISKGFKVFLNGNLINPFPIQLMFSKDAKDTENESLLPYVYEGEINQVKVLLEVGFYRNTPSEEELDEDQVIARSKDEAGWTIVCNDRVVVYKDKTFLTGWGEASVPNFHNQFMGIAGIVQFRSNEVEKLPLTTTKRGIEASSLLYLEVKNYMREGTKLFTSYTNKWKKNIEKEREVSNKTELINVADIPSLLPESGWKEIRNKINSRVFQPNLPKPTVINSKKQIRFMRDSKEIDKIAEFFLDDISLSANEVGEACFDHVLEVIKK